MKQDSIHIKNARTHNLKNISLEIPKHQLVVFTGVSGSGKSSLVFDTIYTEAQRQLIETFSTFARARMPKLSRPDVDEIRNISTAIVIDQKRMGRTLRSTVGTATEINTYLRLLFSRCGDPFIGPSFLFGFNHPQGMCPDCKGLGKRIKVDIERLIDWDKSIREGAIDHPDYKVEAWNWREMVAIKLFDVDKKLKDFSEDELNYFLYSPGIQVEKSHGAGTYTKNFEGIAYKLERLHINKAEEELSEARKNAYQKYFHYSNCDSCGGTRLNESARSVKYRGKTIAELCELELTDLLAFFKFEENDLDRPLLMKIRQNLVLLIDIGVGYLSLDRAVATLSGGESQRVKMARQLDCDLVDMMYILDEPSIGLHPKDGQKLIAMMQKLRDKGNSVLVVEHDPEIIRSADWIVDIGPNAGVHGGELIFEGRVGDLLKSNSITGKYLIEKSKKKYDRKPSSTFIELKNVSVNNLKNVSTQIPVGVLTCVTGVAGSGKSSLINEYFVEKNKDVIVVDQSAVGRSVRSNPVTYIGAFDLIRKEFAAATNSQASLFSFNSKGACPKCKGKGYIDVEMSFLDTIKITCDECDGKRYTDDVLELKLKGKSIFDVLNMTNQQALEFFKAPNVNKRLHILVDVGLGYLELGQPLSTLSGGEAQRIKLASELHKKGNIYVMDEPTTGLHKADIERLLKLIKRLVDNDNTVIVIEHNLDIIRQADWIIDLGPEGGAKGGEILFEGRPEEIVNCKRSYTGQFLNLNICRFTFD
ncbi:MAG: excinuclease ABC subunit UvrA [Bacteroidales bacterium]|nr:excinuclease ABC subunit UvrA [Bacteroidales bacterium]MCF8458355.1 excinuclease ABC subunit UvrA [Bacteroidales bacterium]